MTGVVVIITKTGRKHIGWIALNLCMPTQPARDTRNGRSLTTTDNISSSFSSSSSPGRPLLPVCRSAAASEYSCCASIDDRIISSPKSGLTSMAGQGASPPMSARQLRESISYSLLSFQVDETPKSNSCAMTRSFHQRRASGRVKSRYDPSPPHH
jgi:hypothetical protein